MRFEPSELSVLFDLLRQRAPEMLPICRWLVLGPWLAETALPEHARAPTVRELVALQKLLEREGAGLNGLVASLLTASGAAAAVRMENQLDRLVETDPSLWSTPGQILERPMPDLAELLAACRARLAGARQRDRRRLRRVEEKLERAVRLEDSASSRRAARVVTGEGAGDAEEG